MLGTPGAHRMIRDQSLTVRISKVSNPLVYEVYASGVKIREESYVIKERAELSRCTRRRACGLVSYLAFLAQRE